MPSVTAARAAGEMSAGHVVSHYGPTQSAQGGKNLKQERGRVSTSAAGNDACR
jgi:hypothetical protein